PPNADSAEGSREARAAGDPRSTPDSDTKSAGDERREEPTDRDADDLDQEPVEPRPLTAEIAGEVRVRLRPFGRDRRDNARRAARERPGGAQAAPHDDERGEQHEAECYPGQVRIGIRPRRRPPHCLFLGDGFSTGYESTGVRRDHSW